MKITGNRQPKGLPACIVLLILATVVFLLQLSPLPGIYLMFLLAPFWSLFLVNAAMLAAFFDVLNGRRKVLLALPALYFGVYGVATVVSHIYGSGYAFSSDLDVEIAPLIPQETLALNGFYEIEPKIFLHEYDLQAVTSQGVDAIVENGANCKSGDTSLPDTNCISTSFNKLLPDMTISSPDMSSKEQDHFYYKSYDIDWTVQRETLSRRLTGKIYIPLDWFPMPVAGCILIDNPPAWKCSAQFLFEDEPPFSSLATSVGSAIAALTGLHKRKHISAH